MSAEDQKTQTLSAAAGAVDAAPKEPKEPKEVVLGEDGKPLSKGELKKRAKEAESECESSIWACRVLNSCAHISIVHSGICAVR
jgi:hypothetical protein